MSAKDSLDDLMEDYHDLAQELDDCMDDFELLVDDFNDTDDVIINDMLKRYEQITRELSGKAQRIGDRLGNIEIDIAKKRAPQDNFERAMGGVL